MKAQLITTLLFFCIMTILTGIIYPIIITDVAQLLFPFKANGSLVLKEGKIVGSELIGQKFDSVIYFHSRPSATGYNPIPSGASNLSPTSSLLKSLVKVRRSEFLSVNAVTDSLIIPPEMIFASGSGLDPHISPDAVLLQVERVVKARNFNKPQKDILLNTINKLTEKPDYFFLGEKRVNVLLLNLELDKI